MPTQAEETQAKEFLKRAEIRTMKKDLRALREIDALSERDKIAKIKTLEDQLSEHQAELQKEKAAEEEKNRRQEILGKNEAQEKIAEKDLKNYGTEEERQKIFLFESQRLGLEKELDSIDKEKEPALKLQKNNLQIKARQAKEKLEAIVAEEKKFEGQQNLLAQKAQSSQNPAERKSLEQGRWDVQSKIQEIEKKRWESEKLLETINNQAGQIDKQSELLVAQKKDLRNKILGADKSLREIYSGIIAREEERRKGKLKEQQAQKEASEKSRLQSNEQVRRQQWNLPQSAKNAEAEEEQRKKFLREVDNWSQTGSHTEAKNIQVPLPPVPKKKI